jgi:tetratricopeptide (TPR) repeat protein
LVLTLTVASWVQTSTWRDTFSIWSHAITVTEGNYRAHNNLGAALGPMGRYDEAAGHFHLALEAFPDYASAHGNLGKVLDLQGRFAEAEQHFRRAVELDPTLLSARVNWAMGLSVRGRYQEAIDLYRQALEIDPGNEVVLGLMAQTQEALGSGDQ